MEENKENRLAGRSETKTGLTCNLSYKNFGNDGSSDHYALLLSALDKIEEQAATIEQLKSEVESLKARTADQDEEIFLLKRDRDVQGNNQCIQLRLIKELRDELHKDPQPTQKDRSEILRALITTHGGKMLAKEARQKLHLSKSRFSELLATMQSDIEIKPYHRDRRQSLLIIK